MKKLYILIIAISVILISILGIKINKKYGFIQTNETAQRIYKQGLNDIKNGDLQNAYYNFSKISKYNSYFEASLFRQGLIATELNDNESAVKAYETLLDKFPNTFFAEKSIYNLAVAYFKLGINEKAYANFKLITKKYSDSDYADAANYFLGVLTKDNDKKQAISHFISYINDAPAGKYSLLSVQEILELDSELTENENLSIGRAYLENKKYDEAINYFSKLNIKNSWAYLTVAYKENGEYIKSKSVFKNGLSKYSQNGSEIQELAVEKFSELFRTRIQGLKEAKTLCDKSKCQLNDYIMFNLIPSADKQIKNEYYNRIYEEFPDGNYAPESLFNSMFNDYLSASYDNAIIKGKKHLARYSGKKSAPAVTYWLAKTYDKKRNTLEANNYYNKVLNKYKDTYYAYLAFAKLNKYLNPYEINNSTNLPTEEINIDLPILHTNLPINATKKIDELLAVEDFKIFEYTDFDNEIIRSWVAYYEGNYANSSVSAEKFLNKLDVKPNFDDDIYKLIYPIAYTKEINEYGNKSNISPFLLISLIKKESRFNPKAVSNAGAIGLMQLMPDTADYIAGIKGIKYKKSELYTPEYNIDLGTKYYEYIKSNHHSSDVLALASYNGGYGNVSKWLNTNNIINNDHIDEFVEKIPFAETKDYIKQIYKNYWVYSCIYNSSKLK